MKLFEHGEKDSGMGTKSLGYCKCKRLGLGAGGHLKPKMVCQQQCLLIAKRFYSHRPSTRSKPVL